MQAATLILGLSLFAACALRAQPAPPPGAPAGRGAPPLPVPRSPVDYFRRLLALSPADRDKALADKSAAQRRALEAKLREYEGLSPTDRELRLRATELRWYLLPLLQMKPAQRRVLLEQVPAEERPLVDQRLVMWDLLPPPLQQELLENEKAIDYFTRLGATAPAQRTGVIGEAGSEYRQRVEAELARWVALPAAQRRRMLGSFNQFFQLNDTEKANVIAALPEPERELTARTVAALEELPSDQRLGCLDSFDKFSEMSPAERARFLQNAERWRRLSPEDQAGWRDLFARLPPLPPGAGPPLPPPTGPIPPPLTPNSGR
jgi:hypothetical protein